MTLHLPGIAAAACLLLAAGPAQAGEAAAGPLSPEGATSSGAPAEEEFLTAGELLDLCRSPKGSAGDSQCLEFILGLAQTVTALQQNDPSVQYFCIDPQTTAIQVVQRVLVQGLGASPGAAGRPAFEVAIDVLGREWPCMSFDTL